MLPSTGYFSTIPCPFFANGLCQRHYCHFRHSEESVPSTEESQSSKETLEKLVQDAVKKILFTEGQSTPMSSKIEEILAKSQGVSDLFGSLPSPAGEETKYDKKGRRLYLPPKDAPVYNPTPLEELKKTNFGGKSNFDQNEGSLSSTSSYLPAGLAQMSNLVPSFEPKRPRKPPKAVRVKNVLGDISDMSESDEDTNAHVVGSILMEGMKSGVYTNVDEFQHELIKNRTKIRKTNTTKREDEKEDLVSCDRVSSSSEVAANESIEKKEAPEIPEPKSPQDSKEDERLRLEREEAKSQLEQKEMELLAIEAKRKVLEDFYKNRRLSTDSTSQEKSKTEDDRENHALKIDKIEQNSKLQRNEYAGIISASATFNDMETSSHGAEEDEEGVEEDDLFKGKMTEDIVLDGQDEEDTNDEDLPETVKSFLEVMTELDKQNGLKPPKESSKRRREEDNRTHKHSHKSRKHHHKDKSRSDPEASKSSKRKLEDDRGKARGKSKSSSHGYHKSADKKPKEDKETSKPDRDTPKSSKYKSEDEKELRKDKSKLSHTNQKSGDKSSEDEKLKSRSDHRHHKKRSSKDKCRGERGKKANDDEPGSHRSRKFSSEVDQNEPESKSKSKQPKPGAKISKSADEEKKRSESSRSSDHAKKHWDESKHKKSGTETAVSPICSSPIPDLSEELDLLPEELCFFNDGGSAQKSPNSRDNVIDPSADDDAEPCVVEGDPESDEEDYFDDDENEELRKIFNEFNPTEHQDLASKKKGIISPASEEKEENAAEEGAVLSRKRVAHSNIQQRHSKHVNVVKKQKLSPSQALMNRYKLLQNQRKGDELYTKISDLMEGNSGKRKAHQPPKNLAPEELRRSNLKKQLDARRKATESHSGNKTVGHTIKGMPRLAHTPTNTQFLQRPIITGSSKLPSNVRQRYLNSIVDECLKIYGNGNKEKAYERSTKEEEECYNRSKNRNIYLNVVVNCIKKLRKEAAEKTDNPTPGSSSQPLTRKNLLTTHMQVLAGKAGTVGTWSIEKKSHEKNQEISNGLYYDVLKRYILTEEQLKNNGYPTPDPSGERGKAVVQEDPLRPRKPQPLEKDKRNCDRCLKTYSVDKLGHPIKQEDCIYHWGRLFRRRGDRSSGTIQSYSCCQGGANSDGCQVHSCHVTNVLDYNDMRGFVSTLRPSKKVIDGNYGLFALDCEMCNTTKGNELTRVTVVNVQGDTVYEALVKPEADIVDYNTRFSGITAEDLIDVKTTIRDVQAVLLSMFSNKTILIGHSLESDLKALKMLHSTVIDTSVVFPHKMGPPYKRALKSLSAEYLQRLIQNDVGGHDSKEDALACLDLMKMKAKEDVKKLKQMAEAEARKKQ